MTDVFLVKCGRFLINAFLFYCWNGAKRPCDEYICKMAEHEEQRIQCKLYCEKIADKLVQLTKEISANKALQTELASQEQETRLYIMLFIITLSTCFLVLVMSGGVFWICYKRRQRKKRNTEHGACNTSEPSPTVTNPDPPTVPTAPLQTDEQSNASGFSQADSAIETDVMLPQGPTGLGPCVNMISTDCSSERSGKSQLVPSLLSSVVNP